MPELRPQQLEEGRPNLVGLLVAILISFTVVTALALGIVASYGAVTGILYALVYPSRQNVPQPTATVLIASESHASGD
jgi:hypothetical protein